MYRHRQRIQRGMLAVLTTAAVLTGGLVAGSTATAAEPNPLPVFEFGGIITDKEAMIYNPTNEYIFPSVFHAGAYLENPLGEWYLYFAPHDNPGGVMMMYSDSPAGPWTEFADNPIIENEWLPYYSAVPHVSSPDAFWNEAEQKLFMFFHGDNGTTRFATSTDGVTFDYGAIAITNADGGPGTTETSYARVFEHPDPTSAYSYAMFYMDNTQPDVRRIRVAESVDARTWKVRPTPLVVPTPIEGQNVSGGNLWEWNGQLYVIYHASSGTIYARTVNAALTEIGPPLDLFTSSGIGADVGRAAAPDIVTDGDDTYLFYESGDRLGATIAWAKLNPDAVRPTGPEPDGDPLREQCQGAGSDEFEGSTLDRTTWPTIVRETDAAHSVGDGSLTIPTYRAGVNGAPLIQQAVPSGPWEATTQLSLAPTASFQQAGLLLYRDDANYAKFDFVVGSNGKRIEFILRTNGSDRNGLGDSIAPPADLGDTFWLRLASDGTTVTAALSTDGKTFIPYGRTVNIGTLAPTAIGPFAMRGTSDAAQIPAVFDWFRWTPNAAELEECAAVPEVPVPTVALGSQSVEVGMPLTVSGSGFAPNSTLEIWIESSAVLAGQLRTDADGAYSGSVTVPLTAVPGDNHRVRVVDPATGDEVLSEEFAITAAPAGPGTPAPAGPAELPVAGTDPSALLWFVAGSFGLGGILSVIAWRRRPRRLASVKQV